MNVITGFGYYTEIATGHILAKVILPGGTHTLTGGLTYTEVADQAALDQIEVWQPDPPAPVPVGDFIFNTPFTINQTVTNFNPITGQNLTGGALMFEGFMLITAIATSGRLNLRIVIAPDAAFENEQVAFADSRLQSSLTVGDEIPIHAVIPKNWYYLIATNGPEGSEYNGLLQIVNLIT